MTDPEAPRILTRDFGFLTVAHLLQGLGYASNLLLPLYLTHLMASREEIGLITGTAAVGGLVARPVIGWALDSWGRKPTLVCSTGIVVLGMALLYFVRDLGALIYLDRVLYGVGTAGLFTAYFTFAADIVPAARRTEGLALFGVSGLIPLVINPFTDQIGVQAHELRWFIPLIGVLVLLSLCFVLPLREPHVAPKGASIRLKEVVFALTKRRLWSVWVATVAFSSLVAVFFAFATVTAERRGLMNPSTLWLSYAGGAIVVRLLGARLPDRVGPANIIAPALGAYVLGALWVASAHSAGDFLAAGLCAGVGHGYCFPVLSAQVVSRVPDRLRGSGLAMFTALWALTGLIFPPLIGGFGDRHGDGAMFALTALVALGLTVLWALLEHLVAAPSRVKNAAL